jgi:hypothetical protein
MTAVRQPSITPLTMSAPLLIESKKGIKLESKRKMRNMRTIMTRLISIPSNRKSMGL